MYKLIWRNKQQINATSSAEMIGIAKLQLQNTRVFFRLSDQSTVYSLRKDSTCLDAAFKIHSNLGLIVSFISINGKPVALNEKIKNGQIINIHKTYNNTINITKQSLLYVNSKLSKITINKYLNKLQNYKYIAKGLIYLLYFIILNSFKIQNYYYNNSNNHTLILPEKLNELIEISPYKSLTNVLIKLGNTHNNRYNYNNSNELLIISQLFQIKKDELIGVTYNNALKWTKIQCNNGWNDNIRELLLIPLFKQLPINVETKWIELTESNKSFLLTNQKSVYFNALAKRLISVKSIDSLTNDKNNSNNNNNKQINQEIPELIVNRHTNSNREIDSNMNTNLESLCTSPIGREYLQGMLESLNFE